MSTPAATARYVITADDKTGLAIKSILSGFKEVDKSVRGIGKTLNEAAGLFIGVKLIEGLKKVIDVTAKSAQGQKGFALALDQVRSAATDLLASSGGLPEATKNMEELRDVLQDPALKAAADSITSTLIAGFTASAKAVGETVAGLRELGVQHGYFAPHNDQEIIDANEQKIKDLQAQRDQLERTPQGRIIKGDYAFDVGASRSQIAAIDQAIAQLKAENEFVQTIGSVKIDVPELNIGRIYSKEDIEAIEEADKARKAHLNDKIGDGAFGLLSIDPKQLEDTRGDYVATLKYLEDDTDKSFEHISKSVDKSMKSWTVFADEAARGTFNAFADFFFDPFQDGIRGLGLSLIDTFRRALANRAAQELLEYFSSFGAKGSNSGKGGIIGSVVGAIFGAYGGGKAAGGPLQQGKWYTAGERGPEPIWGGGPGAFATGYGGGGGMVFAPVTNIDARGATTDFAAALPAILRQNNEALKSDILGGIQRRKYPLPSRS